jgi:anti-anti-sigma factor
MKANLETKLRQDSADTWTLTMMGSVDQENYQFLSTLESNAILNQLVEAQAKKLIIDLASTEQFDSLGLQFLLLLHKQLAQKNIQVVLRNPNPHLRRVLHIMQFDRIFSVEADDEAEISGSSE